MELPIDYSNEFDIDIEQARKFIRDLDPLLSKWIKVPTDERSQVMKDIGKLWLEFLNAPQNEPQNEPKVNFSEDPPKFNTFQVEEFRRIGKEIDGALSKFAKAPSREKEFIEDIQRIVFGVEPRTLRPLPTDWPFMDYIPPNSEPVSTLEELIPLVDAQRSKIHMWKEIARTEGQISPIVLSPDQLKRIEDGISGSYLLQNELGRFIVKPMDEDISHLHNPKGIATPFDTSYMGQELYRSVYRERAVAQIARISDLESVSPNVTLAIFESEQFHDVADTCKLFGPATKEKLCSCMEFVDGAKSLFEAQQDLQMMGLTDEEIAARFDQNEVEDACILRWISGDPDGHGGNILTYVKGHDEIGNEIYGIKNIDSGLAFPNQNERRFNSLLFLPNGKKTLSEKGREKILNLNSERIDQILRENHLENATDETRSRIAKLQSIVLNPILTLKQIDRAL